MEFVVEDPQRTGGITTYDPAWYEYDDATDMWAIGLEDGDGTVVRRIPRERIVYIEGEPEGTLTDR